ncbi:hypothetical protein [Acinetobacter proteolyticus]|uniref:hypothetical protein n=1 Tax=Acinetobacter proteolyticus TaxID=1776741 RepID=UPI00114CBDF8|nr:hypothetical protein [Acinetobacter proteolyticus]
MERFEEVFKAAIQSMHEVNVKAYGSLMANVMLPGLEALKPVFKATYDQGVKDEQEKLEGCVVVPVEPTDEWMANYINSGVENYCEQLVGQTFAVTEQEKPSIKEEWRGPVRKAHALVLKIVEAARGGN